MNTPTAYGHDLRNDPTLVRASFAHASRIPFWLDDAPAGLAHRTVRGDVETDLVIIGGGYCGLWSAVIAKERDPQRRVVLLEASRVGQAASGRNGGFCEASLTHGPANGELHFPRERDVIDTLAIENFEAMEATIRRYDLDVEWERQPVLLVATEPHQLAEMESGAALTGETVLRGESLKRVGNSPLYRAGVLGEEHSAFVHPAKLARALAQLAARLGVEIYENSPARALNRRDGGVDVHTSGGIVRTAHAILATNGFPSLLRRLRLFTVPIYDYVLMTEPLTAEQLAAIGWTGRHGITDAGREFHYYRKTRDNRILFGGYDAVYHRGGRIRAAQDQRPETFERLADHFFSTFPQLADIRFTHKWGGMIDMSTQLVAFHGTTRDRRIAYSAGYTGLGVAATRFGAETMLDLVEGRDTARTRLKMAKRLPIPIPPEPFAYPLIQLMRNAVARSDRNGGKDGLLLKLAGLFKIGFDS